jgi:hypothetical protein
LVYYAEGGAGDVFRDAQTFGEAFGEGGFARAEVARQAINLAFYGLAAELFGYGLGLSGGSGNMGHGASLRSISFFNSVYIRG